MRRDLSNLSEYDLIALLKKQEERVFDTLFDRYFKRLYSFANNLLGDVELAKELTLDVMLRLWLNRDNLVLEEGQTLLPYLFRSMRNAIANHLRKSKIVTESLEFNDYETIVPTSADAGLTFKELEKEYKNVLQMMPEQRRKIFTLSREENLSYAEIAEKLNLSVHTVRNQMSSALDFLKKNFHHDLHIVTFLISFSELFDRFKN